MESAAKFMIAGGLGLAALTFWGRPCRGRRHHSHHRHGHDYAARLSGSEWQGLTEEEARHKLAERGGDEATIDAAIDELDTRGFLAPS